MQKKHCKYRFTQTIRHNYIKHTHTRTHKNILSVWVPSQDFIWNSFRNTSQQAIWTGVWLRRGKIGSTEKYAREKGREMIPCSNDLQMHEPMPAPWCYSSPPPWLNAFARIHPLLSFTREAAHRPSIGQWTDQMNAGNRDKHRLIAHRQERRGTGRAAGVGSCKAKVQ